MNSKSMRDNERRAQEFVREFLESVPVDEKAARLSDLVAYTWRHLITEFPIQYAEVAQSAEHGATLADPTRWRNERSPELLEPFAVRLTQLLFAFRASSSTSRPKPTVH